MSDLFNWPVWKIGKSSGSLYDSFTCTKFSFNSLLNLFCFRFYFWNALYQNFPMNVHLLSNRAMTSADYFRCIGQNKLMRLTIEISRRKLWKSKLPFHITVRANMLNIDRMSLIIHDLLWRVTCLILNDSIIIVTVE